MNLLSLLKLLPAVGPVVAALPEFKAIYDLGVAAIHPKDQDTAKQAYQDMIANNAEGHGRFQQKLAAAEKV